jgi:hypothetical protein
MTPEMRRVLLKEAAYEALGILQVMHEGGEIPLLYRDLVAAVIEKYHAARRDKVTA